MSHLPATLSAEVLSGLPSNKQLEVIRRIAAMEQTSPEVVRDVEASLENRMRSTFNQQMEKAGGVLTVAQILNVTDRMTNRGILETLEEEDSELVEEIPGWSWSAAVWNLQTICLNNRWVTTVPVKSLRTFARR